MAKLALLSLLLLLLLPALEAQGRRKDTACHAVRCMDGFRCKNGNCIAQQRRAVKRLCVDNKFAGRVKAEKCRPRDRRLDCLNAKNALTCGLADDGTRRDFTNDCSPCLDPRVTSFVRLPCADTPPVCSESQECINGNCFELFDGDNDDDRNRVICNKSADCEQGELCVANKCVEKRDLLKTLRKRQDIRARK